MDFSDKLQMLRKQADLTQDELALKIGVSRQAISKWESGNAYPDLKNIQTLCAYFSVSAEELLNPKYDELTTSINYICFDEGVLGSNIKRIRLARGITQEAFAEQMKVSRQSVSKWENGSVIPKTEILLLMLELLDTELSELLPPIFEETTQEEDTEEGEITEETVAEPVEETVPKKKKKRLHRVLLTALISLLVLALI